MASRLEIMVEYPTGQNGFVEAAPTPVNVWHFRLRCLFSFGVEVRA
jgi:hypothetical protein